MMDTKLFELTDYPHIFKKCYWGKFSVNEAAHSESITNRNDFAKEYGLKEFIEARKPCGKFFDHCELYRCKDGIVFVVSHNRKDNEPDDQCAETLGFKKYKNLYVDGSTTYSQVFPDKHAYNRFRKRTDNEEIGGRTAEVSTIGTPRGGKF